MRTMARTLEKLMGRMGGSTYDQAMRRYQSVYDQKRLAAKQAYETTDASLARELAGLKDAYDQQRRQSAADTAQAYSQADRLALSRGMQRSSYTGATLGNISLSGMADQRRIDGEQTKQESGIASQRTLLSAQLSQQLKQYDADQQNDALAYADELRREQQQYQLQLQQMQMDYAMWKAEFDAKYGG